MQNQQDSAKNEGNRLRGQLPDPLFPGMIVVDVDDTAALAPVTVMSRFAEGVDHLDEAGIVRNAKGHEVPLWQTQTFVQAFSEQQAIDAHCVLYGGQAADDTPLLQMPRLTKPGIFCFIDEMKFAAGVFGGYLAIDYDLPNHASWTPESLAMAEKLFREAGEFNPIFKYPTVCYRTAHGLRLIWALYDWINFEGRDGLEDKLIGLVGDANIAGFRADPLCKDWTRHFRLPMVVRSDDGKRTVTTEQKYYSQSYNRFDLTAKDACPEQVVAYRSDAFRSASTHKPSDYERCDVARKLFKDDKWSERIGRVPMSVHASTANIDVGIVPPIDQIPRLTRQSERSQTPSKMVSAMKQYLWNKGVQGNKKAANPLKAYNMLFEAAPMFDQPATLDGFHGAISTCASVLTQYLQDMPHISPQLVFAVIYEKALVANQQRIDSGHREIRSSEKLHREVWDLVSRFWRNDAAKKEARRLEDEEVEAAKIVERERLSISVEYRQQRIADEFEKWMPELTREDILQRMRRWYIIQHDRSYFVLTMHPDGTIEYVKGASTHSSLIMLIRDSGNTDIIEYKLGERDDGEPIFKELNAIMGEFGTEVTQAKFSRLIGSNRLALRQDNAGNYTPCILLHLGGMSSIGKGVFHQDCDDWLHLLFGDMYEKCADWLACYRSIEVPIAALELRKASSVGKGMLVLALSNMTTSRKFSHFNAVFGQFQDTMKDTPLLWADESLDVHGKRAVDTIKRYVTGEANTINCKGIPAYPIEGHWRIVFSANSTDMLESNEVLDDDEATAIAFRVIRVVVGKDCAAWLVNMGGRKFTAGWPEKQLPEHIRWLEETRLADIKALRHGGRFLVEGGSTQIEMQAFVSNNVRADIVLRAIGKILTSPFDPQSGFPKEQKNMHTVGVQLTENHLLVSSERLTEFIQDPITAIAGRTPVGAKDVAAILKKLSLGLPPKRKERGGRTGTYHILSLSKTIQSLSQKAYGDDFLHNGVITSEFYKTHLPEIFESIGVAQKEAPAQRMAAGDAPVPSTNGHHPASANTSPNGRPRTFPRIVPK